MQFDKGIGYFRTILVLFIGITIPLIPVGMSMISELHQPYEYWTQSGHLIDASDPGTRGYSIQLEGDHRYVIKMEQKGGGSEGYVTIQFSIPDQYNKTNKLYSGGPLATPGFDGNYAWLPSFHLDSASNLTTQVIMDGAYADSSSWDIIIYQDLPHIVQFANLYLILLINLITLGIWALTYEQYQRPLKKMAKPYLNHLDELEKQRDANNFDEKPQLNSVWMKNRSKSERDQNSSELKTRFKLILPKFYKIKINLFLIPLFLLLGCGCFIVFALNYFAWGMRYLAGFGSFFILVGVLLLSQGDAHHYGKKTADNFKMAFLVGYIIMGVISLVSSLWYTPLYVICIIFLRSYLNKRAYIIAELKKYEVSQKEHVSDISSDDKSL